MKRWKREGLIVVIVITAILFTAGISLPYIINAIVSPFNQAPEPGVMGIMGMNRIGTTSMYLHWTQAKDDFTPVEQLEYRVYGSYGDNISSVESMVDNGVPLCGWTKGLDRLTVGGTPYYYFNVLVHDKYGTVAAYNTFKFGNQFDDLTETLKWVDANISNESELVPIDLETENDTRLALTGLAMMQTDENYSAEALQRLGARYVLVQFGYLIGGLCGDECEGIPLIQACNGHTAELKAMGLEHENWYGESDQVTTVFDGAEYFSATGAPEPKWFDSQLVHLLLNDLPTNPTYATTQLEYWYARELSGDGGTYTPRLAADGSTWLSHIPSGGNYAFTRFSEAFRSATGFLRIYEIV